jgi:hypothetical protein
MARVLTNQERDQNFIHDARGGLKPVEIQKKYGATRGEVAGALHRERRRKHMEIAGENLGPKEPHANAFHGPELIERRPPSQPREQRPRYSPDPNISLEEVRRDLRGGHGRFR